MTNQHNLFTVLSRQPWWISFVISLFVYLTLSFLVPLISFNNPILQGMSKVLAASSVSVAFLFLVPGIISFFNSQERIFYFKKFNNIEKVFRLSTEDFPKWLFVYFKKQGFKVSNDLLTNNPLHDLRISKDGSRYLVYSRYWKRELTGLEDIELAYRDMLENYSDDCIIITFGAFTDDAWAYAQERPIQLFDRPLFLEHFLGYPPSAESACPTVPSGQTEPTDIRLRADQKAKLDTQTLAQHLWANDEFGHLNISEMARELRKRDPAKHFSFDTVLKWAREAAPVEKRGKRGRSRK